LKDFKSGGLMSERWVERIRFSGFGSEEEAKKFLDEELKWFDQMEAEMRRLHERMLSFMQEAFKPFTYMPAEEAKPKPTLEELIQRLERLEKEIKETKEELFRVYAQQKAKVEIH
jgi:uncharacterized protein YPO0396